ncbi:MAG: phosphatase PAP2 family protein [Flavobacteriales bacterium]|nr:phosphatase PAP2 family protein [Flavobacteriales bacterium]
MIEKLELIDRELFLWLNGFHADWLDQPMYWMTDARVWTPLYVFFLWAIARAYNWKVSLLALLGVILVVALGDRISVELFKEVFQRYRPSRNLELYDLVHIVNDYRGGKYGFVSSHATNFFGIVTFLFMVLKKPYPKSAPFIFLFAALISYTRIYLGVHYPSDIVCGTALGALIGWSVYHLFNRFVWKLPPKT